MATRTVRPPTSPPYPQGGGDRAVSVLTFAGCHIDAGAGKDRSVAVLTTAAGSAAFNAPSNDLLFDAFNLADGSAPSTSTWGTPNFSAGSAVNTQGQRLSMVGGTIGGYLDFQYLCSLSSITGGDIDLTFTIPMGDADAEQYHHFMFRGSGTQDTTTGHKAKQSTGYMIEIGTSYNYLGLYRRTGGVDTDLGTVGIDWQDSDTVYVRVLTVGSSIKVKVWRNAEQQPGGWSITATDATYSTGRFSIGHTGGSDALADTLLVDVIRAIPGVAEDPGGGGGEFDPPAPAAIAGMSLYKNYDWVGATVNWPAPQDSSWGSVMDFNIVNGDDTPNDEKTGCWPGNVTIVGDPTAYGGVYLRLEMNDTPRHGQPYSGVQCENFFSGPAPGRLGDWPGAPRFYGYGQGAPFFVEVRVRWLGFDGFWCGPWMYDLTPPGRPAEVDIMETINNLAAKTTLHSPNVTTYTYAGGNDGEWHRYGQRFDFTGVYYYMDNVLVNSVVNSSIGTAFCNANMGFKLQAHMGGSWPDGVAGHATPQGFVSPQHFDIDWVRLYR